MAGSDQPIQALFHPPSWFLPGLPFEVKGLDLEFVGQLYEAIALLLVEIEPGQDVGNTLGGVGDGPGHLGRLGETAVALHLDIEFLREAVVGQVIQLGHDRLEPLIMYRVQSGRPLVGRAGCILGPGRGSATGQSQGNENRRHSTGQGQACYGQ